MSCWIPAKEYYADADSYQAYEEYIYTIFKTDFIESSPIYNNAIVDIRRSPYDKNKEDGFWHIICKDYKTKKPRQPDFRRMERIRFARGIIENYKCGDECIECPGVKVWKEPYKNIHRIHFLLEEERYMAIIEPRGTYYILVTAFYIEEEPYLIKQLNQYEKFKN